MYIVMYIRRMSQDLVLISQAIFLNVEGKKGQY